MIAKRLSASGKATYLAVVACIFATAAVILAVKSAADDDPISPQAVLNLDLNVPGTAQVQVIGSTTDDHLTGNGAPNVFTDFRRARALAVGDFNGDAIQDIVI